MERQSHVNNNHHENGLMDSDPESDILSEKILAQLVNDDENSWLTTGLIQSTNGVSNNHCNGNSGLQNGCFNNNENGLCDNGGDEEINLDVNHDNVADNHQRQPNGKHDSELKHGLSNVLENEAYKSTKDNLVRELDNLAVLHRLESSTKANKFGRMTMPVRNLETRWESKLEYNKEAKLDTRTITKRKPTFFNRFLSSEELSPNYGNLRNTKLNYSSSNISGSNSRLNNLVASKNELESPYNMRKSKLNNTFTMDEDDADDNHNASFTITRRDQNQHYQQIQPQPQLHQQQLQYKPPLNYNPTQLLQQRERQYQANTATVTRSGVNGVTTRATVDQPVKKKPISMYSVYAEPTDSRPIRSSNTNVLSAYRLYKSSALNHRQVKSMVPRRS